MDSDDASGSLPESSEFLNAACDPRRLKLLTLVCVMTPRISHHHRLHSEEDYEKFAIGCVADGAYTEQFAEDPREAAKLFAFLNDKAISPFEPAFTGKGQAAGD